MAKSVMKKIFNPAHKGELHRALKVPQGQKIPAGKLKAALHSRSSHVRHMAEAAEIGKHINEGRGK